MMRKKRRRSRKRRSRKRRKSENGIQRMKCN